MTEGTICDICGSGRSDSWKRIPFSALGTFDVCFPCYAAMARYFGREPKV